MGWLSTLKVLGFTRLAGPSCSLASGHTDPQGWMGEPWCPETMGVLRCCLNRSLSQGNPSPSEGTGGRLGCGPGP